VKNAYRNRQHGGLGDDTPPEEGLHPSGSQESFCPHRH